MGKIPRREKELVDRSSSDMIASATAHILNGKHSIGQEFADGNGAHRSLLRD